MTNVNLRKLASRFSGAILFDGQGSVRVKSTDRTFTFSKLSLKEYDGSIVELTDILLEGNDPGHFNFDGLIHSYERQEKNRKIARAKEMLSEKAISDQALDDVLEILKDNF